MGFLSKGKEKEREFASMFPFDNIRWATKDEDINEHWDLSINGIQIDVKAMKKLNRTDNNAEESIHWLEFVNVYGNNGWMKGSADYIAFEMESSWLIAHREGLLDKCRAQIHREYRYKEPYYLYQRKGRRDIITMVHTSFISNCVATIYYPSTTTIKKGQLYRNCQLEK